MLLCEEILGKADEPQFQGKATDYVDIEWHEAFGKIHRKTTSGGADIGIHLGDEILTRGLRQDDVLCQEGENIIVVNIPPTDVLEIQISGERPEMAAKVCYEIGNRHAPLFHGRDAYTFLTPYNEPMLQMLNRLHGVNIAIRHRRLDFDRKISSGIGGHSH